MKNLKSILVLSTLVLIFITCSKEKEVTIGSDTIKDDRSALIEIFKANSENTLGWDITSEDVSKWDGITVGDNNRVTVVNFSNKALENLPVEAMQQLTKLKLLKAENNNLKSIDLTGNVNLERLMLNNNKLSAIDVSKNVLLTYLLLQDNKLKELDVSMLSKLRDLKANRNEFTGSVNVANGNNVNMATMYVGSPTLKCVQVDNVSVPAESSLGSWSVSKDASYSLDCN